MRLCDMARQVHKTVVKLQKWCFPNINNFMHLRPHLNLLWKAFDMARQVHKILGGLGVWKMGSQLLSVGLFLGLRVVSVSPNHAYEECSFSVRFSYSVRTSKSNISLHKTIIVYRSHFRWCFPPLCDLEYNDVLHKTIMEYWRGCVTTDSPNIEQIWRVLVKPSLFVLYLVPLTCLIGQYGRWIIRI